MPATKKEQDAFIDRFADVAVEISKQTGVRPEVVLGQTALETGWGKSVAGNNMFGIKGQGQSVYTHENLPGLGRVGMRDSFRAYDSPLASFGDYAGVTIRGRSLSDIVDPSMSVAEQARAIKAAGYATDPNYASSLAATARAVAKNASFQNAVIDDVAAIDPAPVDFTGIPFNESPLDDWSTRIDPVKVGEVDFLGSVPDITPAKPASAGFSLAAPMDQSTFNDVWGAGFPAAAPMDQNTFSAIQEAGFPAAAPMDQGTFDSVFDAGFPAAAPMDRGTFNAIQEAGFPNEQPQGFAAGFDAGPYGVTPDASAPSLDARNNFDRQMGQVEGFNGNSWNSSDLNQEAIASRLNNEFGSPAVAQAPSGVPNSSFGLGGFNAPSMAGPQLAAGPMSQSGFNDVYGAGFQDLTQTGLPSMAASPLSAPSFETQAIQTATPAASTSIPQGDWAPQETVAPRASTNVSTTPSLAPSLPSTAPTPPARPDMTASTGIFDGIGNALSSVADFSPMGAIRDAFGITPDQGFMDAMANPQAAAGYSPGVLDGWTGGMLKGAGFGALTGGPFGALTGAIMGGLNLDGKLADIAGQQLGNFWDAVNFNASPFDAIRSPTSDTGWGGAPGGLGDGSYSEHSGRNENNPQGIL